MAQLKSNLEIAVEIQEAILSILAGTVQSYSIAGRSFTKLNLKDLEEMYTYYETRANRDSYGIVALADQRDTGSREGL